MPETMPPTPVLTTARLRLRPVTLADAGATQREFPQWDIVRYMNARVPWPYPSHGAATHLAECLERMAAGLIACWAITLAGGDDGLIGRIDLWPDDGDSRDQRGFWLATASQGRGLMTEAADAVTGYAFEQLGWPGLWLTNAEANLASSRIKAKQGAVIVERRSKTYVSGPAMGLVWRLDASAWRERGAR